MLALAGALKSWIGTVSLAAEAYGGSEHGDYFRSGAGSGELGSCGHSALGQGAGWR
ncbi:hypothetical protein AERO9A_210189 [Aeromonas salmonicida]|nr:hypothetical protein AERO9A_210189 [Aeromonas salmonicida]